MGALLRLLVLVLLLEAAFYFLLKIYFQSLHRERLEGEWDRRHPGPPATPEARRTFVSRGMRRFDRTLKARLLWLVFIIPTILIGVIVYIVNWQ